MQVKIVESGDLHIVADDLDRLEIEKLRKSLGMSKFSERDVALDILAPLLASGYALKFEGHVGILEGDGHTYIHASIVSIQMALRNAGVAEFIRSK